jgi:hypothetical protein
MGFKGVLGFEGCLGFFFTTDVLDCNLLTPRPTGSGGNVEIFTVWDSSRSSSASSVFFTIVKYNMRLILAAIHLLQPLLLHGLTGKGASVLHRFILV